MIFLKSENAEKRAPRSGALYISLDRLFNQLQYNAKIPMASGFNYWNLI